ncbi:hypothetical protein ACLB2K_068996 [Fragaria x ananassa]
MERHQINIVEWVWKLYGEGSVIEAADPKLCGEFDEKQVECLMIVGLWCALPDYIMRPSIQQAIQVLNFKVPVPVLPSKLPVATYLASAVSFSKFSDDNSTYQSVPFTSGYSEMRERQRKRRERERTAKETREMRERTTKETRERVDRGEAERV